MLLTIVVFILILGLLIFVHEFGHFIMAKRFGLQVKEFGFGFPPRIFGIKRGETIYSLNLIPLGGFVRILGEGGEEDKNPRSFASQKVGTRAKIIAAGVIMNFLLACLLLAIGFKIGLPTVLDEKGSTGRVRDVKIQIIEVAKDSPAEKAGLKTGDQINGIEGLVIDEIGIFQEKVKERAGKEIILNISRGTEEQEIKIVPRKNPPEGEGSLGIGVVKTGIISYPWYEAIYRGVISTFSMVAAIFIAIGQIIKNLLISGKAVGAEFAGPVGIAVLTGQVVKMGFVYILQFTAILSINLAIINFLPLPALDGGRLLFLGIEKIRGQKVSPKVENAVHTLGFVLLILLMIFVTFKDVSRFKDILFDAWKKISGQMLG